jgi:hypothetical protein
VWVIRVRKPEVSVDVHEGGALETVLLGIRNGAIEDHLAPDSLIADQR